MKLEQTKRTISRDLIAFSKYFFAKRNERFIENWHHKKIADALEAVRCGLIKNLLINIPPRYGKAIDVDTPMMTLRGWIKAGDVRVGDYFIGSGGNWTEVKGVYPQGVLPAYQFRLSDGSSLRCCGEHLWQVNQRYCGGPRVKRTIDLIDDLRESDGRKKWQIPIIKPTIGNGRNYAIDPYLLGCWLGDGTSNQAEICTEDYEIATAFHRQFGTTIRTHQNSSKAIQYGIVGGFITRLKELNLRGNKHIPDQYLEGPLPDRIALLQGLMDTDGTCNKKNGQISFTNCNEKIIDGFKYLITSLGGTYAVYQRPVKQENHNQSYTVNFRLPEGIDVFRLKRKQKFIRPVSSRNKPRRFVDVIKSDGQCEMVCFSVDADDKLFAAGKDLVLTHNTEIAVINFIAQSLAINPRCKFMHLSYSDGLALQNSGMAKELVMSEEFQQLWPITLKADSQSKKKWWTTEGGGVYATSAGGPITGFGAGSLESDQFYGAIIIDDPLKVDDADSESERMRVNKRLNTTIKSRRNNPQHTPIIIIMQRIHEDDMSGYVLSGAMGEDFYHLKLPAIYEGKPLWEFRDDMDQLERQRKSDPRTFNSQMLQDPTPDDGEFFKRDWFKRFNIGEEPPTNKYLCSDYAVSEGKGDFTEHGVGGFDEIEDLWLLDWWSGQTAPDKWIDEELRLVRRYEVFAAAAEGGPIRRSVEPFLAREQQHQSTYYRKEWITSNKDKAANARAFQALASSGKVHIPNTTWGEDLLSQLLKFPNGKFDDKVDVCGLLGRLLDQAFGPRSLEIDEEDKREVDGYGFDEDDEDHNSWKVV